MGARFLCRGSGSETLRPSQHFQFAEFVGSGRCHVKAHDYHRLAAEGATMARTSTDTRVRAMFLHMAEVWARLAEEDESSSKLNLT